MIRPTPGHRHRPAPQPGTPSPGTGSASGRFFLPRNALSAPGGSGPGQDRAGAAARATGSRLQAAGPRASPPARATGLRLRPSRARTSRNLHRMRLHPAPTDTGAKAPSRRRSRARKQEAQHRAGLLLLRIPCWHYKPKSSLPLRVSCAQAIVASDPGPARSSRTPGVARWRPSGPALP